MAEKTDLHALDRIAAPDQWSEIGRRTPTLEPSPSERPNMGRVVAGTVAFMVAAVALLFLLAAFRDRPGGPVASDQPTVSSTSTELIAFVTSDRRIAVIEPDGSEERVLTTGAEGENVVDPSRVHDQSPQWSPDGSVIYFVRVVGDQEWLCSVRADGSGFDVISRNLDGGHIVLSPDGARLAYDGNDGQLHVMNVDASPVAIPDARRSRPGWMLWGPDRPAWSPDGNTIAFAGPADGSGRCWNEGCALWILQLETGGLTDLTLDRPTEHVVSVVWASIGRIVYTSVIDGSDDAPLRIWSIDPDGSDRREIPSDGRSIPVAYAPDGGSLLVGRYGAFPYTEYRGLFVIDDAGARPLVPDAVSAFGDWRG
jgi:dipeptidyl aminopeptidase/acylaminoacyl peptidase